MTRASRAALADPVAQSVRHRASGLPRAGTEAGGGHCALSHAFKTWWVERGDTRYLVV